MIKKGLDLYFTLEHSRSQVHIIGLRIQWKTENINTINHLVLFISTIGFSRVGTDFFIVLLQSGKIFTSFREFTLFHTFSDVPVNESAFGVHEVELVVNARKSLGNRSG